MRLLFFLLALLFSLSASENLAGKLGYYSDYSVALGVAQKEQKPLMLVVVTSYCPWCRKLERKSLADKSIGQKVKTHFIAVIVDRNKDAENFPKTYQTPRIPVVYFIDPQKGTAYWETVGYLSKAEFSEALEDAEKLFKQQRSQH